MSQISPIPEGFEQITPYLRVQGASEAIAFYKRAFGAEELSRLANPDGTLANAIVQIGSSRLMLADEYPKAKILGPASLGGTTVALQLYVEDVDAWFARAVEAGATVVFPLDDQFYGDRSGRVRDPFGHEWLLASRIEEVSDEEMQRRFEAMMAG